MATIMWSLRWAWINRFLVATSQLSRLRAISAARIRVVETFRALSKVASAYSNPGRKIAGVTSSVVRHNERSSWRHCGLEAAGLEIEGI